MKNVLQVVQHSSHVLPYKPSLPSVSSQRGVSDLPVATMQFPSFAPVFSNQGAVNFTANICLSGVIRRKMISIVINC